MTISLQIFLYSCGDRGEYIKHLVENDIKYLCTKSVCMEIWDSDNPHGLLNPVKYFWTKVVSSNILLSIFFSSHFYI